MLAAPPQPDGFDDFARADTFDGYIVRQLHWHILGSSPKCNKTGYRRGGFRLTYLAYYTMKTLFVKFPKRTLR